eukprot:1149452-Amphidinium_carterae.1
MECTNTRAVGFLTPYMPYSLMAASSKGGYCPNEAAELWNWPPGWAGYRNQEHRFNLIETWMLCA